MNANGDDSTPTPLLFLPFTVIARFVAAVVGLLAILLRVLVTVVLVVIAASLLLQVAGVGVDLGPADGVPLTPNGGAETAPDDPGATDYAVDGQRLRSGEIERLVHEEVNDRRADRGLDRLEWDATVASVARSHSRDMAVREFFAHTNPDGEGPYDRYAAVDRGCRGYGENIAMTWIGRPVAVDDGTVEEYRSADDVASGLVDQWMASDGHRENMLRDAWDAGGVGVYVTDRGAIYATHNFCREWGL